MEREKFEIDEDRRNEDGVKNVLELMLSRRFEKTGDSCPWDYEVYDAQLLTGLAEIKCRRYRADSLSDFRVSKRKVDKMLTAAEEKKVRAAVFADFEDSIRWFPVTRSFVEKLPIIFWGRNEPRDIFDSEECYAVPMTSMRVLLSEKNLFQ